MKRLSDRMIITVSVTVFLLALIYSYGFGSRGSVVHADARTASGGQASGTEFRTGAQPVLTRSDNWSPGADNVNPHFFNNLLVYEERLEENPSDSTAMREYAALLSGAHRLGESAMWYRRYLDIRPGARQVRLDLASVYASSQNWAEAQVQMETILQNDEEDPAAQYNMGAILANQGRADEAMTWWRRVAAQTGDEDLQARAHTSLASLERTAGR